MYVEGVGNVKNDPKTLTAEHVNALKAQGRTFVHAIAADNDGNPIDWASLSDADFEKAENKLDRQTQADLRAQLKAPPPKIESSWDAERLDLELDAHFGLGTPDEIMFRRKELARKAAAQAET